MTMMVPPTQRTGAGIEKSNFIIFLFQEICQGGVAEPSSLAVIRFVEIHGGFELFLESVIFDFQPFREGVQFAAFCLG